MTEAHQDISIQSTTINGPRSLRSHPTMLHHKHATVSFRNGCVWHSIYMNEKDVFWKYTLLTMLSSSCSAVYIGIQVVTWHGHLQLPTHVCVRCLGKECEQVISMGKCNAFQCLHQYRFWIRQRCCRKSTFSMDSLSQSTRIHNTRQPTSCCSVHRKTSLYAAWYRLESAIP